ncbi:MULTISPECIES: hypothetical protein [unclassified Streptomyces]|uniref:hypothetical protein n=1 Tax=unclassified Streptomyces TaxID=2593676 RepID=UPI002256AB9B|nr:MULTISPECIES: hypothetical protein [unclassified Streptomyces]MCX4626324.1 hypothetical protein [Streptomyces sp. NBC_01443]WSW42506.1 hypothetical protein OG296_04835 [Streptomyces sp. NBC_01001]
MGAIRTNATALLSAGATGAVLALGVLGAPSATAAEAQPITSFGFAITPSTVAPGGKTVLSVTGCNAAYSTASSGVFDTVSIARGQTARVTVDRDARRGAVYSVSFTCNGETGSADLTITGGTTRPTTSSTSTATARANTTVTSTATGGASLGVRGGLGGSVAGMDPRELGAGAGLFLAAAGGTAYVLRRRRSARGH